jgi:hypothetical protein
MSCSNNNNKTIRHWDDGQGPNDFLSGVFDFSDLFTDLARACLGFLEFPVELVRVRASTYCGVLGLRVAHRALGVGPRAGVKLGREKPG